MERKPIRRHRRRFLKQAGLVTGAGAMLALIPVTGPASDEDADAARARQGQGYRLTAHIRSYYQKAGC
jgi:hypothetical protein